MDVNMYKLKTESIGELYRKMNNGELMYDPFYQRKAVWKEEHEIEFIRTIILGYPSPEIFLSEGDLNPDTHVKFLHVIDGQQRLRTIQKYLDNELVVDGNRYKDLDDENRKEISRYEISTVYLNLNPEEDLDKIREIFRRLNLTDYSLDDIELQVSLFSDNEYMLLARQLSGDISFRSDNISLEDDPIKEIITKFRNNPFISEEFKLWSSQQNFEEINKLFLNYHIYTPRAISRQWHVMDIVNIISIYLTKDFHARNLEDEEIELLTPEVIKYKDGIVSTFEKVSKLIIDIDIIKVGSKFKQRGSFFSLFTSLCLNEKNLFKIDKTLLKQNLKTFEDNLPEEYVEISRNSVHEKRNRKLRNRYIDEIIKNSFFS